MRVLVDYNVLIEMMSSAAESESSLTQLKVMHEFGDAELWASAQSFMKLAHALESKLSATDAQAMLADVLSWLRVCQVGEEEVQRALSKGRSNLANCLELVCAERVKADFIVTGNAGVRGLSLIPSGSADDLMDFVCKRLNVRYAVVEL